MANPPTSIDQFLFQRGHIKQLLNKKNQHDAILDIVRQVLPATMSQHCLYCVTKGSYLTLFVSTAAWATQIRYYTPTILEYLNHSPHSGFGKIQVRILPTEPLSANTPKTASRPNTATINAIQTCAENCRHGKLKESLLRLADTLRQE